MCGAADQHDDIDTVAHCRDRPDQCRRIFRDPYRFAWLPAPGRSEQHQCLAKHVGDRLAVVRRLARRCQTVAADQHPDPRLAPYRDGGDVRCRRRDQRARIDPTTRSECDLPASQIGTSCPDVGPLDSRSVGRYPSVRNDRALDRQNAYRSLRKWCPGGDAKCFVCLDRGVCGVVRLDDLPTRRRAAYGLAAQRVAVHPG